MVFALIFPGLTIQGQCSTVFAEQSTVTAEMIPVPMHMQVKEEFIRDTYRGIIQSQLEFARLWEQLENSDSALMPDIDFNKYSLIWFVPIGARASSVQSIVIVKQPQRTVIKVDLIQSDYFSHALFLWRVPKIEKNVVFEESKELDGGLRVLK